VIAFLKSLWGVLSILPILLQKIEEFQQYVKSREFQQIQDNLSTIAKQLEGAKTHEERLDLAAKLSDIESEL
jgi:hypothetical protein